MSANTRGLFGIFVGVAITLFTFLNAMLALRYGISVDGVRLSGIWDHPHPPTFTATLMVLAIFSFGYATLLTAVAARVRRGPKYAENVRYRKALATGQVHGDANGWLEQVERQLGWNKFSPLAVLGWVLLSWQALAAGPRWPGVLAVAVAVFVAWSLWRDRRRLKSLRDQLAARAS